MRKIRSRLLITLVLFGILSAAAVHAQTLSIGKLPAEPIGRSEYDSPVPPSAGEPDATDHSPVRGAMSRTRVSTPSTFEGRSSSRTIHLSSADAIRWAWVIWMAQYLNQLP